MAGVLLLLAWRADHYLSSFRDDVTLWEATAPTCPTSGVCREGFGAALVAQSQIERGINELIRSVEIRPHPEVLSRLGDAYTLHARDYRQAIIAYELAIQQAVAAPESYYPVEMYAKLARAHMMAGAAGSAARAIQAGRAINPNDPYLLVAESFYQAFQGDRDASRKAVRAAMSAASYAPPPGTSGVPRFLYTYWNDPVGVGRLMAFHSGAQSEAAY
jgi:hypothetical protein